MNTATAYAAATLHAPVEILGGLDGPGRVRVRTLAGGVGGWNTPGRELLVDPAILRDITDTDGGQTPATDPTRPVPVAALAAPIDAEDYIEVLLTRQAAWVAAHSLRCLSPLLEWFVEPGDEQWVRLPDTAPAAKREVKPRVYRSAAAIRAELVEVEAKMASIAGSGPQDGASVNLSPHSRSRAARNAGRRRFVQLDRDLARYTALDTRRAGLAGRLAAADAREAKLLNTEQPASRVGIEYR